MWVGLLAYLYFLWLPRQWTYLMVCVGRSNRDRSDGVAYFTIPIMTERLIYIFGGKQNEGTQGK